MKFVCGTCPGLDCVFEWNAFEIPARCPAGRKPGKADWQPALGTVEYPEEADDGEC